MAADDFERGKQNLDKLIDWWQSEGASTRNEATTRLHLIDGLLQAVLGWPKGEITAEQSHGGTYTDYQIGKPATRLIVEAKKEGIYFELPAGAGPGTAAISSVTDGSSDIKAAVEQVLGYCQERGVALAVVTNGHQILAFVASRQDGVPPLTGRALVFDSLAAIRSSFQLTWDNLSPAGVEALNLHKTLGDAQASTPPEKLAARIPGYPGYWTRNRIQTELKILGDLVLQDIVSAPEFEREFLARCYSSSGTLSEYALVSKEILEARYSALDEAEAEASTTSAWEGDEIAGDLRVDVSAAGLGRRPVLLLGDVGVGKSIFIRHFMQIDAKDVMERSVVLYINFGGEPALADDLNEYVMDHFVEQLREVHGIDVEDNKFVRNVYRHDLQSFANGIHGPLAKSDPAKFAEREIGLLERKIGKRDQHLRASLRHVSRTQRRQVVVFLDNIDQRDFEFQERVFLIGQSLAETWPATVFLSLRPDTFYRSRSTGSLTAYQPRAFTIEPPDIGNVITKRLTYCGELVADETSRKQILPDALNHQAALLADYLKVLLRSFRQSPALVELVENLGGGNVREALGFLNTFVGSGHVDTRKILEIVQESGGYNVPLHEFVRAVVYGDYRYYDPTASPIANVFEISAPDPQEHFLLPLLLAHIERSGEVGQQEGFVAIDAIMGFAQGLGFLPTQVEFAIRHATNRRLVQRAPRLGEDLGRRYRITTVGAYTYKKLVGTFVYLDAVVVDTPIVDQAVADAIDDCQDIRDRMGRSKVFSAYLDQCWEPFRDEETAFDWPLVSETLSRDYERINRTLAKRKL